MKIRVLLFTALLGLFASFGHAADKLYADGSVWTVTTVKTVTGHGDEYLNSLQSSYKALMDEAKKQGLILSYKVLSGEAANKQDWDILLLVEYKNMAALDGIDEKFDAIDQQVIGNTDKQNALRDKRQPIREILGGKLVREVVFK